MKPAPAQAPATRGPIIQTRPASAPVTAPRTTTGQVSAPAPASAPASAPVSAPASARTGRPKGRTYLPAHRRHTSEIRARITDRERAQLEAEAREQELTLSELVRLRLLNRPPIV